jgi:hypothetical protein
MSISRLIPVVVMLVSLLALSACETSNTLIKRLMPIEGDPNTFRNLTYTAGDEVARQLQKVMPGQVPMTAGHLKAVPMAGATLPPNSPLPGMVMQLVSSRLVQHGYKVTTAYPAAVPAPVNPQNKDFTQVTLGGDYLMTGGDILVHLEVVEEKTGRMLAAHDFTLPGNAEITGLMAPGATLPAVVPAQPYTSPGGGHAPADISPVAITPGAVPAADVGTAEIIPPPASTPVVEEEPTVLMPKRKPAR